MIRFVRFGFTGIVTNTLGYIIYLIVTFFGVPPKLAMTILYFAGVLIGFSANRRWVFVNAADQQGAIVKYGMMYGVGYMLNYGILYIFVDRLHYAHAYVQAFGIVAVAAFVYVASSIYVFPSVSKRKRNP